MLANRRLKRCLRREGGEPRKEAEGDGKYAGGGGERNVSAGRAPCVANSRHSRCSKRLSGDHRAHECAGIIKPAPRGRYGLVGSRMTRAPREPLLEASTGAVGHLVG